MLLAALRWRVVRLLTRLTRTSPFLNKAAGRRGFELIRDRPITTATIPNGKEIFSASLSFVLNRILGAPGVRKCHFFVGFCETPSLASH